MQNDILNDALYNCPRICTLAALKLSLHNDSRMLGPLYPLELQCCRAHIANSSRHKVHYEKCRCIFSINIYVYIHTQIY